MVRLRRSQNRLKLSALSGFGPAPARLRRLAKPARNPVEQPLDGLETGPLVLRGPGIDQALAAPFQAAAGGLDGVVKRLRLPGLGPERQGDRLRAGVDAGDAARAAAL